MNSYLGNEFPGDDTFQISMKNLKKASRRAKTGLISHSSKNKLSKPQLNEIINESPYAQIQSINKNRSISSIKLKVPSKNQQSHLNSSSSNALLTKHKSNPTAPQSFNISENSLSLKPRLLIGNHSSNKTSAKSIEEKLLENLRKIKDKQMPSARFDYFRIAFDEIIEKDESYGALLKKIKEAYEQQVKTDKIDTSKETIEKLKDEIKDLREKVLTSKDDKKFLVKKIEKLAKENAELSRHLEDRESRYVDLQDKLLKLSKVDLEDMPKDENSWKYLVSENQHLLKVCEEMRKDIKHLSRKEKKLVKLIIALKNRGYPVEDVYQEDVHRAKEKKPLTCDEPVVDDSENEDLISGRAKEVQKPAAIPSLNLEELERSQESSGSSCTSESEEV